MTRGQLRRSLAVEALLISLVSGISGVLLGTLFGWLGAYVVFSLYGTVAFPFEWGINGIVLAVAAVAALLASIAPAVGRSGCRQLRRSQKLSTSTGGLRGKPLTSPTGSLPGFPLYGSAC